jgi:DNA-binding protein H-NS
LNYKESMMAVTLAQLNKQITKLQREADLLKASQAKGVIARIREDISRYQLTAADLGFESASTPAKQRKAPAKAIAKKSGRNAGRTNVKGVIKFRDDAGRTWTGHGRAPGWFNQALESGRTREELEVKAG